MRDKWEREDYRTGTIEKCLSGLTKWHVKIEEIEPGLPLRNETPNEDTDKMYNNWFLNTHDFSIKAEQDTQSYLIEPLLTKGGLHMISGLSFAGKTPLLLWLMGRMMRGQPFFNYRTHETDVVYFNGDNIPIRRVWRLLSAGLHDREPGWHYCKQIGDEFNARLLEMYCDLVWHKRPDKHLLVVLDTLRPLLFMDAKRGDDLDSVAMTQKIKPYKDLVVKYKDKLTIWFAYHNARTTGEYYGSGAFMNLLDSYWNYEREKECTIAKLGIQTRDGFHTLMVKYEEGQFTQAMDSMTQEQVCDFIVAKEGCKLSMTTIEKELKGKAKRDCVRTAWQNLSDYKVLVSHEDSRYMEVPTEGVHKYEEMKVKYGWKTTPPPLEIALSAKSFPTINNHLKRSHKSSMAFPNRNSRWSRWLDKSRLLEHDNLCLPGFISRSRP